MVSTLLPLGLALPLLGAVTIGLGGLWLPSLREQRQLLGGIATLLVGITFSLFLFTFLGYEKPLYFAFTWDWFALEPLRVPLRYQVDSLSLWMALIITGIGTLIHLYSIGYMGSDEGAWRYFALLNLFIFSMLTLVLADSLPLLFLGWEGVGACSYFLIGFWFAEEGNAKAAQKAFIMNRIGDVGLLAAMIILYAETGTFDIDRLKSFSYAGDTAYVVGILLFFAATGKSAQIPLYTWLPDAMAGPTPVSALIHAATMVTAGIYLLARMDFLYNSAPEALYIVAGIGVATALLGAAIALAQHDIKRILAYSTVSQLGFMFASIGAGAYTLAIFHVFTHAFFKALLFLGAGSVIHTVDTQDIREMGGLRAKMPITGVTFWVGVLAIAGLPPLAGFFSKDEILAATYTRGQAGETLYYIFWGILMGVAFLTAFYMGRMAWLTFEGTYRGRVSIHESPMVMTIPLLLLGIGSVGAGFVGLPSILGGSWLREKWLSRSVQDMALPHLSHETEIFLIIASTMIAIIGLLAAWYLYGKRGIEGDKLLSARLAGIYAWLASQAKVDLLYERIFVQSYYVIADLAKDIVGSWVGRLLPNTVVKGIQGLSDLFSRLHVGYVPLYVAYMIGAGLLFVLWMVLT
ncbi:MAG: NADH-quinone oxidoreductase subunit L [Bacteroidia bacterium]|nr:NADH-quinone oxidoreductase subunit L [Bacteroidia bacterium]MDW8133985.1 NADH-quinone oxidoreductase subunit L [Bacteroidia bacterium]